MKKVWIAGAVIVAIAGIVGVVSLLFGVRALATVSMPVEDIQYPFEKGGGLVHIAVDDIFMGIGMLTAERKKGGPDAVFTGSVNFEPISRTAEGRIQVDRIRLIERTSEGKDGRIFEPGRIYDDAMERGLETELQFPKEKGKFPFAWENGESDCIFFVFDNIPEDVLEADLVITYNGKFPHKKHAAYYEDRLSVKRKSYFRG